MHFALSSQNFGTYGDPLLLAELASDAEAAGWDGFFVWDHLLRGDAPVADPWISLAAVAIATERLRIGTMVTPLSRRRPWQVARQATTLDHLSNGRVTLGVGLGSSPRMEFEPFAEETDDRRRAEILDESLDIVTRLWSGETFDREGAYTLRGVRSLPPPLQRPRIPIWVAGNWPNRGPLRRAARYEGVFPQKVPEDPDDWMLTPEEVRSIVTVIDEHRSSGAPFDVAVALSDEGDRVRRADMVEEHADAGVTWWMEGVLDDVGPLEEVRTLIRNGPRSG
ncbi:MAG: LLM class flavin-dependent oxidoreductase [Actinomycetota bacterium]|nr:LLM class flavin-dependent oxidoreductase [Actinomycetota bacterium]